MQLGSATAKTFNVRIENRNGMLVATSEEVKGMLVVEYSLDALEKAIKSEVEELLAARGDQVEVSKLDTPETDGELLHLAFSAFPKSASMSA